MMKLLFTILLSVIALKSYSCRCISRALQDNFNSAEFVAAAKIIEITADTLNSDYHIVEIEMVNLYKGEKLDRLRIHSMLNSSCAFYTEKNSTWLIFASTFNGILSFHYCSGSVQLDQKFDEIEYPGLTAKYKSDVAFKLSVLNWLKENKIDIQNNYQIQVERSTKRISELKGYKGGNRDFAIVEYSLEADFTLKKVKLIKKFKNKRLSRALKNASADGFKAYHKTLKEIPKPTKLYAIYYFYPEERNYKSFLSASDN